MTQSYLFKMHYRRSSISFNSVMSYSIGPSKEELVNTKSFQDTILLPKTKFPNYLKSRQIIERDQRIQKEARFLECYDWQRQHVKGEEFVLHDGPPYANGKPHIGHAINKILKDIILRSQLLQGRRVNFVPGWDCHGLPIEMIAIKNMQMPARPNDVRQKAKETAHLMSNTQKEIFMQWGLLGDWSHQCYYTYDVKYIINELQMFWKLYEKGLIYYDLKPVFWSPSSKTALAESELIYKNHISKAITVRFQTTETSYSEPVYLLIWTTTPWTIPLNKAIFFSSQLNYSLIKIESFNGFYIIATDLIEDLKKKLKKEVVIHSNISYDFLCQLKYVNPWKNDESKTFNVFESSTIKLKGTGLLHTVPAHGFEDFLLCLHNNISVDCSVDENGCYLEEIGFPLQGLNVLEEGSEAVINKMSSDIIIQEDYCHSYPHDWRTNKPVIIRASNQWFIDTNKLKKKAIEQLDGVHIPLKLLEQRLKDRPYWCISRQRSWGVPIPVFFHKNSNRPLLSKNLIDHICNLFDSFGPDIWWSGKLEQLFPDKISEEVFVNREDIVKGQDILDIWFDSGISWSFVLNGKKSDLYLEGMDQYGGWFQSSLLTSVAVENGAPFKKILTHGFAVDENLRKMSKSLGNVVDPEEVVKGEEAFGVDTLRWWVGEHSHHDSVPVSRSILEANSQCVQKIRTILRFLLGALHGITHQDLTEIKEFQNLDIYLLNACHNFYYSVFNSYTTYNFRNACANILYFVTNEISSRYITVIKDRLYCDEISSNRRKACLYTINAILHSLCYTIAPILPHLAEEVFTFHPLYQGEKKLFFSEKTWIPPASWKNNSADTGIFLLDGIKKSVLEYKNSSKLSCLIEIEEVDFELLKHMQYGAEESIDSELTEILQVAEVRLKKGSRNVSLTEIKSQQCPRCRRFTVNDDNKLCFRCRVVLLKLGKLKL